MRRVLVQVCTCGCSWLWCVFVQTKLAQLKEGGADEDEE